jgi:vancomycin permeability regulator SanA
MMKTFRKTFYSCAGILIMLVFLQAGYLVFDGLHDDIRPADAIVVLGRSAPGSHGKIYRGLKSRLDMAYDLYEKGFGKKVIISGDAAEETAATTEVMGKYLIARGIPADNILSIRNGFNTYASACEVRALALKEQLGSVLLVSQYFHMPRCKLAFRKVGFQTIFFAHSITTPEWRDIYALFREVPALYYYFFRKYPD